MLDVRELVLDTLLQNNYIEYDQPEEIDEILDNCDVTDVIVWFYEIEEGYSGSHAVYIKGNLINKNTDECDYFCLVQNNKFEFEVREFGK